MKITIFTSVQKEIDLEIERCLFCHSDKLQIRDENILIHVFCRVCGGRGPLAKPMAEAIRLWNQPKRTNALRLPEHFQGHGYNPPTSGEKDD